MSKSISQQISVLNHAVNCVDGLYSLNDLHKASGTEKKYQPSNFMRLDTTKSLVSEIEEETFNSSDVRNKKIALKSVAGRFGGTYACKELVYSYAMWISAKFHLAVIRVFDKAVVENQFNIPKDLTSALRLAANLEEQRLVAINERDEAITEKGQISNRREAVVMGRLGAATKKISHLESLVGDSATYKQAKAIGWLKDYFNLDRVSYQQIGRQLTKLSKSMGMPPKEIEDTKYGAVKAYDIGVIQSFKNELDADSGFMSKYRIFEGAA